MSEDKPQFARGGVIKGPTPTIWPWCTHQDYPGEEILPLSTIERLEEAKKRMASKENPARFEYTRDFPAYEQELGELREQLKQVSDAALTVLIASNDETDYLLRNELIALWEVLGKPDIGLRAWIDWKPRDE